MLLAEVVDVVVEGGVELLGNVGVVGARVEEEGVVVASEGFAQELPEVAEADDGDFQGGGSQVLGLELGLVVEWLGGVDGAYWGEQPPGRAFESWFRFQFDGLMIESKKAWVDGGGSYVGFDAG